MGRIVRLMVLNELTPHEALRVYRERAGLSQFDAAVRCETNRPLWIEFEKGRAIPAAHLQQNIERVVGMPVALWRQERAA